MITIRIPDALYGNIESNFIASLPSISDYNDFIPINALSNGTLVNYKSGRKKFIYGLYSNLPDDVNNLRNISQFCNKLQELYNNWYEVRHNNLQNGYHCTNGLLIHIEDFPYNITPLLALCVKKDHLFTLDKDNIDYSKLCLVIDRNFIRNEEHFKLYRNVKKHYIDLIDEVIDIHYTNSITNICYNPGPLEIPKFKTIAETIAYTNSMNELVVNAL